MANNIIFDESHYFMCTNGLKPARMKSNQTVLYREDGNYYLTVYSLKCKGLDFSCRWAALVMAIVGAVIALLCSCPAGWVLLAALGGAVAGACLGSAICGDMAAIMRIWLVIKADASISGYDMVSNKMTPQLQCGVFSGVISYVPNVKTVFDEYFIFAYNTLGAGLEGFMYAYAFRGVGLLATAPKTFLCNFAANFLKSWSLTGVVFRGAFAEIARRDTYYNSETEGHDREKENTAFAKAFFFERAVAENIHEAVTSDEENAWKKSLHIAKSVAPVLLMGGIQGGKKVGNKILDATQSDVVAAAKETVPAKIAEQIKKGIDAAKEYRTQLRSQSKGVGAEEKAYEISLVEKSQEAFDRAQLEKLELGSKYESKTVASDDIKTLSGWKDTPEGYGGATPKEVKSYSDKIGHQPKKAGAMDQKNRGGFDGKYNSSHAEKKLLTEKPNEPIGVDRPMCDDCTSFAQKQAIATGKPVVVTDPNGTHIFQPDGTEIFIPK